eukprot:TRINITY_DN17089_c0_g1_i1.p1 TRINITY_DN17089_c0_g1~~TRINITY_DN17089_c0_g1_i1.p1  ORF type:complete len:153 (+),score=29.62 TRINITY_DN17089_c0_g1_i1:55-459(+)
MAAEAKLEPAGGGATDAAADEVIVLFKWMYASNPRKPKTPRQQTAQVRFDITMAEFAVKARDIMDKNEPADHWTRIGFIKMTPEGKRMWEPLQSDDMMKALLLEYKDSGDTAPLHMDLFPADYDDDDIRKVPVH